MSTAMSEMRTESGRFFLVYRCLNGQCHYFGAYDSDIEARRAIPDAMQELEESEIDTAGGHWEFSPIAE